MFYPTNSWGFPRDIRDVVSKFDKGEISLTDALSTIGSKYSSYVSEVNTSYGTRTEISFGVPCVATCVL